MSDRRTALSKKMMKEALIELMKTRPIYTVSIKKICEQADVNRTTFYRYYNSQFDLLNEITGEITADITEIIESVPDTKNKLRRTLEGVLTYFEENRETCLVLLSENSNLNIGEMFSKIVRGFMSGGKEDNLINYCVQFISAGLTSIIWLWLNEENRSSPEELSAVLTLLLRNGVKDALGV